MTSSVASRATGATLPSDRPAVRELLRLDPRRVAVLLVVLLWLRLVVELVVLSFTTEKRFVPVGQEGVTSESTQAVASVLLLATTALAAAVVATNLNAVTRVGIGRLALFLTPWLYLVCRDAYAGHLDSSAILFALVVLALAALNPGMAVLRTVGALTALTAIIALLMGIFFPETGILHDLTGEVREADKALLPGLGLLQGPFTSENNLAQYLALGLPAVFTLRSRWLRGVAIVLVLLAIGWSSSRGGLLTAGAVLVTGAVLWPLARLGWRRALHVTATTVVGLLAVVGTVLPFLPWPADAFTERGLIWQGSADAWVTQGELFGLGTQWFTEVGGTATTPLNDAAYHAHNQFLQLSVTGGLALVALATIWLAGMAFVTTHPGSPAQLPVALVLVAVVVSGFLEVPVGFVDRWQFWGVTAVPLAAAFFAAPRIWRWSDPR